ncbi:RidA family protein [Microvirga sp. Mcv34]|uniref:RidA family protein n=1 Tax=Microvirga sp. Mcv34 TaxID=2926016 RepID=UPI0021CA33D4|nr:RidA family protein [Microvirga sp. Mcv34]
MTIVPPSLITPLRGINPPQWLSPRGYSHAMAGTGTFVFVGGQIATDASGRVMSVGLVAQARQALRNVCTVLAEAGGAREHIAQMTWYVLDIDHYRALPRELGVVYREVMGRHYPAMVLVEVTGLADPSAVVEIAATAILPVGSRLSPMGDPTLP